MMVAGATRKELRRFGLLVGGVMGAIGLWPLVVRGGGLRTWAIGVSALLVGPALLRPESLGLAYRLWMTLAAGLAWLNTRIVLGLVFYAVVTPMGLVGRAFGHDPMRRRFERGATSYRVSRTARPAGHMRRQF
jgi:hypothetical protein